MVVVLIVVRELRSIKLSPAASIDTATMMDIYAMVPLPLLIHTRKGSLLSMLLPIDIVIHRSVSLPFMRSAIVL